MKKTLTAISFIFFIALYPFAGKASPKIVVTIKPIYSLVASITKGVAEPTLLLKGNISPHHYSLRPSEIRIINDADILFYIGNEFEFFIEKTLQNIHIDSYQLISIEGLTKYPARSGHDHDEDEQHEHDDSIRTDPHIWLSPDNAIIMAKYITKILSKKYPDKSDVFNNNLSELITKINIESVTSKEKLAKITNNNFVVYHDSYQYFEKYFGINIVGAFSNFRDEGHTAKNISDINALIKNNNVLCALSAPEYSDIIPKFIGENNKINIGTLDPLGHYAKEDSESYIYIINQMANSFTDCGK